MLFRSVGFNTEVVTKDQAHSVISKALNKAFSPEFLNRVDDIVMFDQLSKESISEIIDIELPGPAEKGPRQGRRPQKAGPGEHHRRGGGRGRRIKQKVPAPEIILLVFIALSSGF